jgi:hypothetical protein
LERKYTDEGELESRWEDVERARRNGVDSYKDYSKLHKGKSRR